MSFGIKLLNRYSENLMVPNFLFCNQPSQFISIINLVLSDNVVHSKHLTKIIFNSASFCLTFVVVCSRQYLTPLLTPLMFCLLEITGHSFVGQRATKDNELLWLYFIHQSG